jgi:hypothetical protein
MYVVVVVIAGAAVEVLTVINFRIGRSNSHSSVIVVSAAAAAVVV